MTSRPQCPDATTLSAWLDDELEGSEADLVRAHIEHCDRCRTELLGWLSAAPGMPVRPAPAAASPAEVLMSYARPKTVERKLPSPMPPLGWAQGRLPAWERVRVRVARWLRYRIFEGEGPLAAEGGGTVAWPRDAAPSPHCLTEELLVAYSEGDLRGAEGEAAEQHLRDCASCVAEVQRLIALRIAIGEPTPERAAEPQAALATTAWAAAARVVSEWVGRLREWSAVLGGAVRQAPAFSAVALAALVLVVGAQLLSRARDAAEFQLRGVGDAPSVEVIEDGVVGRARPADDQPAVAVLARGTTGTPLEESGGWTRIELPDGRRVWVRSTHLSAPQREKTQ